MRPDQNIAVADWLTGARARAWCGILGVMTGVVTALYLATARGGVDFAGKPLGTDFVSFWTASLLALRDQAASVYDPRLHQAAEHALSPSIGGEYYAFFYPPPFLLLCLPLAILPYLAALTGWLAGGLAVLGVCMRRLVPQRWAILPMLVFPGTVVNAGHGQNGFVTAACLGWSMVLAERRPFLAGACLGLLVIKPQLLVTAPAILLAARRWRAIAGALTSGLAFCALSWTVLGGAAWRGFIHSIPLVQATLERGLVEPWKMQSVFAGARLLGAPVGLAAGLQAAVAILVIAWLCRVASRRPGPAAEGALLVAGGLLCTPFLLDYDLVCLALPIGWVALQAEHTGWLRWEKIVLLASFILPLASRPFAMAMGVPVAPLVIGALLLIVVRREKSLRAVS